MLSHPEGGGQKLFRFDQTVDEPNFIEALGGKPEPQSHLRGDGMGQAGEIAVVITAEQPSLGFGNLEHCAGNGDT